MTSAGPSGDVPARRGYRMAVAALPGRAAAIYRTTVIFRVCICPSLASTRRK